MRNGENVNSDAQITFSEAVFKPESTILKSVQRYEFLIPTFDLGEKSFSVLLHYLLMSVDSAVKKSLKSKPSIIYKFAGK